MQLLIVFVGFFVVAAASDDDVVTYGSVIKLQNAQEVRTLIPFSILSNRFQGSRLHSHEVKYGSGSGQQSVTGVRNSDDVNSHWAILAREIFRLPS